MLELVQRNSRQREPSIIYSPTGKPGLITLTVGPRVTFLAYSKNCHVKNFGTKDLRQANLPNRDQVIGLSPPTSPHRDVRVLESPPSSPSRPRPASIESTITGGSFTISPQKPPLMAKPKVSGEAELRKGDGRIWMNDLPGLSPLSPTKGGGGDVTTREEDMSSGGADPPHMPQVGGTTAGITFGRKDAMAPLVLTSIGTRYGRGLTGVVGDTNRKWGGGTPACPQCGKLVYFAEQVSRKKGP